MSKPAIPGEYWNDGKYSVVPVPEWIKARAQKQIGRSKTFGDPQQCVVNGTFEPTLTLTPGPKSMGAFVKMLIDDYWSVEAVGAPKAKTGKFIPDFPHTCPLCGGRMLQLFSSIDHEGGECPAVAELAAQSKKRR